MFTSASDVLGNSYEIKKGEMGLSLHSPHCWISINLCRFYNGAGTDATGTHTSTLNVTAVGYHSDLFQVRQETSTSLVMGMGNIVPGGRSFATNSTYFCHGFLLISLLFLNRPGTEPVLDDTFQQIQPCNNANLNI